MDGTRQSLNFVFQNISLPSVSHRTLGKYFLKKISLPSVNPEGTQQGFFIFLKNFFAECPMDGTRQSFEFFLKISLPNALWPALGKV